MRINKNTFLLLAVLICVIIFSCTKNTLFDNELGEEKLVVKGTVQLSDNSTPDNVYLWLEGVNVSAFTDSTGKFEIHLPPRETQPGGGLNGVYKLYCYVDNYKISKSSVAIVEGNFVYDEQDINEKGEIRQTQILDKILEVRTVAELSPENQALSVRMNPLQRRVKVQTYKSGDGHMTSYFVRTTDVAGNIHVNMVGVGMGISVPEEIITAEEWIITRSEQLPEAEYEIIPYIKIVQEDVPPDLLKSLGVDKDDFHLDYLKIPFKREFSIITHEVVGSVRLSDGARPDNVFIWLEGLNYSQFTGSSGGFTLELPSLESQPEGGMNGQFRLFYYVGTYQFETSDIVIENGLFVYGKGDVNYSGRIRSKKLQKLLDITTNVSPDMVGANRNVKFTVHLLPADSSATSAAVETYKNIQNEFTSGFIQKNGAPIFDALLTPGDGALTRATISDSTEWIMHYLLSASLTSDEYKFIPYINIKQPGLPYELIQRIGMNSDQFHINYLRTPYKREGGEFVIK